GEEASTVERGVLRDLGERDLGHHGVLREGRCAHEVPDRLPRARAPRRSVREKALALLIPDGEAEIRALVAAVDALAALRREARHTVVARPARTVGEKSVTT